MPSQKNAEPGTLQLPCAHSDKDKQMFADLLREWRLAGERTQREAALYLKVALRTYQAWEHARQMPTQPGPILLLIERNLKRSVSSAAEVPG